MEDGKVLGVTAKGIEDGVANFEQPEDGEGSGQHREEREDDAKRVGGVRLEVDSLNKGVEKQVERAHQRDQMRVCEWPHSYERTLRVRVGCVRVDACVCATGRSKGNRIQRSCSRRWIIS